MPVCRDRERWQTGFLLFEVLRTAVPCCKQACSCKRRIESLANGGIRVRRECTSERPANIDIKFVMGDKLYGQFAAIKFGHLINFLLCYFHAFSAMVDWLDDNTPLSAGAIWQILFAMKFIQNADTSEHATAMYDKFKTDVLPAIVPGDAALCSKIVKYFDEQWFSRHWRKTWLSYYRIEQNIDTRLTTGNAAERFHIHFMRHMCNFRILKSICMLLAKVLGVSICGLTIARTLPELWSLRRRELDSDPTPPLQRSTRQRLRECQSRILAVRADIGFGADGDHVAHQIRSFPGGGGVYVVRKRMAPLEVSTPVCILACASILPCCCYFADVLRLRSSGTFVSVASRTPPTAPLSNYVSHLWLRF